MKKIHITESQLVELYRLNEEGEATSTQSTSSNSSSDSSAVGANQNTTTNSTEGSTTVTKNQDGLTATKNSDGTGTVTVPQDKVNDRSGIRDIATQNNLDPNKTTVVTDRDGNGDVSNTVAFMGTKQDFMNPSLNNKATLNAQKTVTQDPNNMAMATPYNTLARESTFVTSKKVLKEYRRNYLIDNSLVTSKKDIKNFLKN